MKKLITLILCSTVLTSAYAQQACPLTNVRMSDLRSSASKLAKTITMSAECKAYADTVNQANANLKNIALKIADTEGKPVDPKDGPDMKATAQQAVTQLDTISTLFKDQRCGEQLVGFLDYASVFVDVVTNMAPFLALYGEAAAMPWVLGTSIGGAVAKSLILFFQNKAVNMRDADQSNNFLKNSCSFYNLNTIKESLDELELRQVPSVQIELENTRVKLANHIKNAPKEPSSELNRILKYAEKDQTRIKFLQEQMKIDNVEGCSYIKTYASKADADNEGSMVTRVWNNYERSFETATFQLDLEKRYFFEELNPTVAAKPEAALCTRWLTKIALMHEAGFTALKKVFSEDPEFKMFQQWKDDKFKLEESIKLQEAKVKFFNELTGNGFNIEYSEIIRSHKQVQNAIFESYKWLKTFKMKGLSEAWLKVKYEDSQAEIKNFYERKAAITQKIEDKKYLNNIQQDRGVLVETCNQLRRTWTSWYNGSIHAKAGRDYCVTFERVINRIDYPEVQKMCFGTTDNDGKKSIKSLRNKVVEFAKMKPEADEVLAKMRELNCPNSENMSTDLLARPL